MKCARTVHFSGLNRHDRDIRVEKIDSPSTTNLTKYDDFLETFRHSFDSFSKTLVHFCGFFAVIFKTVWKL